MRRLLLTMLLAAFALASAPEARAAAAVPAPGKRAAVRRATAKPAAGRPVSKKPAAPRTLADVHIDGDLPVPQVLFVTARDQRRFSDLQHRRYLRGSRALGEATPAPTEVVVTRSAPATARPR